MGALLRKPSFQETSQAIHPLPAAQLPTETCLAVPWRQEEEEEGGRTCCQSRKPFNTPIPSLEAEGEPYLAAARRSRQWAWLANGNLPPATSCAENKLSPCRTEQLGLGMWAWSGPGWRRGERGGMAGA